MLLTERLTCRIRRRTTTRTGVGGAAAVAGAGEGGGGVPQGGEEGVAGVVADAGDDPYNTVVIRLLQHGLSCEAFPVCIP